MSEDTIVATAEETVTKQEAKQDKRGKVYEPKICTVCGKLVTGRPWVYKAHVKNCIKKNGVKPISISAEKVDEPKGARVPTVDDIKDIKNEDIRKIMETALAVQQEMRRSPAAFVGDITSDENMTLRKTYAPETIEKFDNLGRPLHSHTAYMADARTIQVDVARGYWPVIKNGQYICNRGGDILCTMDRSIHDGRVRNIENESRSRISRVSQNVVKQNPGLLRDGEIKEEVLGVTGTITLNEDDRITGTGD
jgi:hypothetical protein